MTAILVLDSRLPVNPMNGMAQQVGSHMLGQRFKLPIKVKHSNRKEGCAKCTALGFIDRSRGPTNLRAPGTPAGPIGCHKHSTEQGLGCTSCRRRLTSGLHGCYLWDGMCLPGLAHVGCSITPSPAHLSERWSVPSLSMRVLLESGSFGPEGAFRLETCPGK